MKTNYHHGDLANSLVSATVALLQTRGLARLSLREVAREAGVSHGAPAHHFGDKSGLLTAVAIQGYQLLQEALSESQSVPGRTAEQRLLDAGYAYIRFGLSHTAHFEVMFQPALTQSDNPDYIASSNGAKGVLEGCIRDYFAQDTSKPTTPEQHIQTTLMALWSQVHGFVTLWLAGNLGDTSDSVNRDRIILDVLGSITPKPYQA